MGDGMCMQGVPWRFLCVWRGCVTSKSRLLCFFSLLIPVPYLCVLAQSTSIVFELAKFVLRFLPSQDGIHQLGILRLFPHGDQYRRHNED